MKNNKTIWLIVLSLAFFIKVNAQQDNLWTTEFGSRSALLGGAVTASVRDNSAIYYNPGALGFIKNSNIGLSANIVNLYTTYLKGGAGDGKNIYYPYLNFVPQFISGVVKLESLPYLTFTYAAFNKHQSKLDFFETVNFKKDLFTDITGEEEFSSTYQYYNEISETWVGAGAGFLLSEHWSVGYSLFFSYRNEAGFESLDNVVFDKENTIIANTIFSNQFDLGQLAIISKIGVAYEDEYLSWGATVTTTGIRIGLFTGALLNRKESVIMPGKSLQYYNIYNNWTSAWYKHPWEFDTGVQFALGKGIFNARLSYITKVDPYTVAEFDDDAVINSNTSIPLFPNKNSVRYASRPVVNFGAGFERRITNNIIVLTGFKIDRNVFDSKNLDRDDYWVTTKSYWNLYTASLGADYKTKRGNNLIFGVSYRFTNRKNDKQIVNLTNPNIDNYLIGVKTNTADTNISGFSVVVGYTYNFGDNGKKDIRERIDELNPFNPSK